MLPCVRPRIPTLAAALLVATCLAPTPASAGGVTVQNYLTTAQVVRRSGLIFVGEIVRVRPVRRRLKVNRRVKRYIDHWRILVRPVQAITGVADDAALRSHLGTLWLVFPGDPPPGQWIVRRDVYIATWQPRLARPGKRLLVYLSGLDAIKGKGARRSAHTAYADLASLAGRVRKLVPGALEAKRLAWRRGAHCKVDTWRFGGRCLDVKTIFAALGCPPLTKARQQLANDRPLMWCETQDGDLNGLSMSWHPSGELQERGLMVMGKRDGRWLSFWPSGKPSRVVDFDDGLPHGLWQKFHNNGKMALEGQMVRGRADGVWQGFNKAGFALGRYTMKAGTGFVTRWFEDGIKRSEIEHKDGVADGASRSWAANSKLESEGQRRLGLKEGLWRWWYADGKPKRVRCYGKGRVVWQVEGDKVGKRRCAD